MAGVCRPTCVAAVTVLVLSASAFAGVVQTRGERLSGAVALGPSQVSVAGKTVPWDQVLFTVVNPEGRTLPQPHAVRLLGGEVWAGAIASAASRQIEINLPALGRRKVEQSQVSVLDFLPGLSPPPEGAGEGLQRIEGEPVPGSLVWLDAKQLAIDSPLGVLTLPREGALRYVFATRSPSATGPAPDADADEVALLDGTLLRGRASPLAGALSLDHALLGKVALPASVIRFVVRHPPQVAYLAQERPSASDTAPLIIEPRRPEFVLQVAPSVDPAESFDGVRGIRIYPKTTMKYRLSPGDGSRVFRAVVQPAPRAAGDAVLRLGSAGKTLLERTVAPGAAPALLSAPLPQGDELTIEVDLGKVVRLPCGVVLADPHVIRGAATQPAP